ncbi:Hsp20/alpha crystallin family protein [Candidatus Korarchaeum cryptofilum]|jgi:HSP20 family protein|uniref:Heat shock protein Hsp20 n=1 Tax=Korarchaeum cryptofilum (strain OPF8) TaxID=374847 RepID=B1L3V3_KORCO|nr:Hsp20/alpha crystallin family protein [Candidatus Korarchaeum cryptofilum]ACB07132.1 heat shock protein Hsp20 [Candidatus Korarchaeum cryptofilum OPF8]
MGWFYREIRWGYFAVRDVEEPLYDVRLTKDGVVITVDLPGVRKEDLVLNASEEAIYVEALSHVGGARVRYKKLIRTPIQIDPERIEAKFSNGILYIWAPPKEVTFRRVKVE